MDGYFDLLDVVETRTRRVRNTKMFERVVTSMLLYMQEQMPESLRRMIHSLDVDPVVNFHLLTCAGGTIRRNLRAWRDWDQNYVSNGEYLDALRAIAGSPKGGVNQKERLKAVNDMVHLGKFKSRQELCRGVIDRYESTRSARFYRDSSAKLWRDEIRYLLHSRAVRLRGPFPEVYDVDRVVGRRHHKSAPREAAGADCCGRRGSFGEYSADTIDELFSVIRTYPGEDCVNELVVLNPDVPDVGGDAFQILKQFIFSSDFMYRLDLSPNIEKIVEIRNSEGGINYFINFQSIFL